MGCWHEFIRCGWSWLGTRLASWWSCRCSRFRCGLRCRSRLRRERPGEPQRTSLGQAPQAGRPGGDSRAGAHQLTRNVWLLITLSAAAGLPARVSAHPWQQALAWLIGSAIWIAFTFLLWLVQGRSSQPSPLPEIPADEPPVKLSRPVVLFGIIRAVAVAGSVAIAFGLHLSSADWMPVATLIAMKLVFPSFAVSEGFGWPG